jgi:hypothetical protein
VFAVAAVLLLSMGGAIVAAPVTVPLLFVASRRHPTRAFRATGAVVGGLSVAEVAWALTYLLAGEPKPWVWLLPLAAGAVTAYAFSGVHAGRARRVVTTGA